MSGRKRAREGRKDALVSDKQKSWLFDDVPVYKVGEGKKARWFAEVGGQEVEVRPVNAYTLYVLWRTYYAQMPDAPILEMELEGVAASQRSRNYQDAEYIRKTAEIFSDLDEQLQAELLKGLVIPPGDDWATEWTEAGRPLPPTGKHADNLMRIEIYLASRGLTFNDRTMLIRVIQAITEETPTAIERAQEFFRLYVGREKTEAREDIGRHGSEDEPEGRGDGGDAGVAHDAEAVVQDAPGGPDPDDSVREEPQHEGISRRPRRQKQA